jgi:exodeoxyribonuclease V gamma subunit
VSTSHIGPLGIDPESRRATALAQLDVLVDLYRRAMREPLPLYTKTSAAYAETAFSDEGDPAAEAAQQWTSTRDFSEFSKEDSDPEHRLVLGGVITLDDILAEAPRPDEQGEGWFEPDPSRFARYAKRLWFGVLRHEVVTHQ